MLKDMKNKEVNDKLHKEKLLEKVLGKDRKQQLEKKLTTFKGEDYLTQLAKPKDKWKRGRILMELKK